MPNPGDPLRGFWLAQERLHAPEARSINRAEILTARKNAAAEAAEVAAAKAAFAETAAAVAAAAETAAAEAAAAEAAAAAGSAAKAAADAPGAQAESAPELPKEPSGGAGGIAEDAKELPAGPSREALHRFIADRGGGEATALDLVEMLEHRGES
jgi:hypothetical protein